MRLGISIFPRDCRQREKYPKLSKVIRNKFNSYRIQEVLFFYGYVKCYLVVVFFVFFWKILYGVIRLLYFLFLNMPVLLMAGALNISLTYKDPSREKLVRSLQIAPVDTVPVL